MIRCSHCGKLVPAGATSCQSCGMPLTTANGGAGVAGTGQAEQQELPAWLESLRAHERPVANNSGAQPFTMAELVDEHSTPSWMRQDQSRLAEAGASDAFPALAAGGNSATFDNNLEASSLIDEQSLPAWMRNAQENGPQAAGQGFSANSLVQQDALPPWMKNLAPAAEPQMPLQPVEERYGLPTQAPTTQPVRMPQTPQPVEDTGIPQTPQSVMYNEPTPAQGFLAHSLVDQQEVPDWLKNAQVPGTSGPLGAGFAAGELIDQRTLPDWMKDQQGHAKVGPVSAMGVPVSGSGQRTGTGMDQGTMGGVGMPVSTFVDKNSLPAWISEDEQRGAGTNFAPGMSQPNGMAAGSLIDMNAMPAWMKSDNTPPSAGTRGGPTRAEGMRVPSRPRGDILPQQQSEAAANVFSSMLGVSSSAPLVQGQQSQQGQPSFPAWQAPQQSAANQSGQSWPTPQQPTVSQSEQSWQTPQPPTANQSGQSWQVPQSPIANQSGQSWQSANSPIPQGNWMGATPAQSPIPNSPLAGGQPGNLGSMQPYPGYAGGSETNRSGFAQGTLGVGSSQRGEAESTKKKGVFESIRDFFFH
ncbi:MAG: hypothetical protein ABI234_01520 [Ktedonobacteraceae bacterium]